MDDRIARGVNFVYAKEYVVLQYGEEGWERVLGRLSSDAARVWRSPLMLTGTYSFAAFKALAGALAAEAGGKGDENLAKMYEFIADRSLSSIYKVFFRMASPSFVVNNYPRLWARFFTAGAVAVREAGTGTAIVEFTLPSIFLDWLPAACLGYSTKAVTMAGGRELSMAEVSRVRRADGEWAISYQLRWRE